MARKNRLSVPDGIYHISSRIANRQSLLKDAAVKEKIIGWMYDVADFSGVDVLSWCIMDNHFHMLVHVPPVPRAYWLDPNVEPAAYAQTMRPPECEFPRWTPESSVSIPDHPSDGDSPSAVSPSAVAGDVCMGDSPSAMALANRDRAFWEALEKIRAFRPPVGFMLTDEQMRERLSHLYGSRVAQAKYDGWQLQRSRGQGEAVDEEKRRYCRRMYNVSQFVKTFKERVAMRYNREFGHEGCLWQGRFYSGVVEDDLSVKSIVAAYIEYNPCRAGIVARPDRWQWSSYAAAVADGPLSERCRLAYERLSGLPWREVRVLMEAIFADKVGPGVKDGEIVRASQAIHRTVRAFSRGAYIGRSECFLAKVLKRVPTMFPRPSARSLQACGRYDWTSLRRAA